MENRRGLSLTEAAAGVLIALPAIAGVMLYITGAVHPGETAGRAMITVLSTIFISLFIFLVTMPLRGRNRIEAEAAFPVPAFLLSSALVAAVMTAGTVLTGSGGVTLAEASVLLAAGITAAAAGYAVTSAAGRKAAARG